MANNAKAPGGNRGQETPLVNHRGQVCTWQWQRQDTTSFAAYWLTRLLASFAHVVSIMADESTDPDEKELLAAAASSILTARQFLTMVYLRKGQWVRND
jgi:hypothetical protein